MRTDRQTDLVDLEGNPGSRDDDLLNAIHIREHPLIIEAVWSCVTEEHTVEPIHEVITAG